MKMITNKQIVVYKFEDTLNSINLDEVWINTKKMTLEKIRFLKCAY